jgi:DNA-binding LytR/AlgR family response regulator
MKFRLIIDKTKDEEVVITAHAPSELTDKIAALVTENTGSNTIPAYTEDDLVLLPFSKIACITVLDGKTYAIDEKGDQYRLKLRLYELEQIVPAGFIRINKSTLANEAHLERFTATYSGGINAVFKSGYEDYVSRRCFANIKRRFESK